MLLEKKWMIGKDYKDANPDSGIGNDQCYNFKLIKSKMSFRDSSGYNEYSVECISLESEERS